MRFSICAWATSSIPRCATTNGARSISRTRASFSSTSASPWRSCDTWFARCGLAGASCWPEPAGFTPLWKAFQRTYDRLGCDPYIGRRLVSLLHDAGAAPVRSTWIYFGSCAAEPKWPGFVENIHSQLAGTREAMVEGGLLGAAEIDAALGAFREWAHRPEAAIWYAICWAEGVRR